MARLILASTSRYRAELLGRLRLPFEQADPAVDEAARPGEPAATLAQRLAVAKAAAVADRFPQVWVLGSDQVAELDGRTLGKPGDRTTARAQLAAMSGRSLRFHTGLALLRHGAAAPLCALDLTTVQLRALDAEEIERYLDAEPALDCAGSFKMEGLGISLFERIASDDPTGLIGLPLIATCRLLRQAGFTLP